MDYTLEYKVRDIFLRIYPFVTSRNQYIKTEGNFQAIKSVCPTCIFCYPLVTRHSLVLQIVLAHYISKLSQNFIKFFAQIRQFSWNFPILKIL